MSWLQKIFNFRQTRRPGGAPQAETPDHEPDGDIVKPFLEHLEDLRGTLFKMAFVLVIGMIISFFFREKLMEIIKAPLKPLHIEIYTFGLVTPFMLSIRLAFYAGIVISFPFLLYFAADFVLPALTRKERRFLIPGILIGFVLFAFGVLVAYYYVLPKTIEWLYNYSKDMGMPADRIEASEYFKLVTHLTLACGLICELPIVVIALALFGIVGYEFMAKTRAYAVTLLMIVVAVVSPTPDPITFLTLSLPVIGIYELCIWIVWLIERKRK